MIVLLKLAPNSRASVYSYTCLYCSLLVAAMLAHPGSKGQRFLQCLVEVVKLRCGTSRNTMPTSCGRWSTVALKQACLTIWLLFSLSLSLPLQTVLALIIVWRLFTFVCREGLLDLCCSLNCRVCLHAHSIYGWLASRHSSWAKLVS